MKRFAVLFLFAALASSPVQAGPEAPSPKVVIRDNVLSAVALNSTQTITANMYEGSPAVKGMYSKARLLVTYTYSAATAVTTLFQCSADGTNYSSLTARNINGGTATVSILTDSITTSAANKVYMLEYDVRGCLKAKWAFAGTSADASDLATVDLILIAGN